MSPSSRHAPRTGRATVVPGLCAVGLLLTAAAFAVAVLPQQTGRVDLLSQPSLRIDGATADDQAGASVAGAGDVNGDGLGDLLIGAPARGALSAGAAYVVFGREDAVNVDLGALGRDAFRISGAADFDRAGASVAGAGDVNGDGLADVVVGAPDGGSAGAAYVVFGQRTAVNVDLAALGASGFRIDGASDLDQAGTAVAGAGDVNGDGLADILIGAPSTDENGTNSGSAYVVFGRQATTTVNLAALGTRGFRMNGAQTFDAAGKALASAGDVNLDGRPDILVGAPFADNRGRAESGSVYVVFGQEGTADIELGALGRGGFRIDGAASSHGAGESIAPAGDLNEDRRPDILVGVSGAANNGRAASGSAYVVFGPQAPSNVDLATLGGSGFRIDGATANDGAGGSVAGAGDLNGDGFTDVLVGATGADNNGRGLSGTVYGVAGKTAPTDVDLATLQGGIRIDGAATFDAAGAAVAGVGDVNGDGRSDVLVGAPFAGNNDLDSSGSAYVVFGFGTPQLSYPVVDGIVGTQLNVLPTTLRRTGKASFSVRPPLPAGFTLDGATGEVAGRPTGATVPRAVFVVTMTDLSGSATALLALQIATP